MIECIAHALRPLCDRVEVVIKHGQHAQSPQRVLQCEEPIGLPNHPLSGVYTGLHVLENDDWAVFVPCDTPHITNTQLRKLIDAARMHQGSVASDGLDLHPLLCCVPRNWVLHAKECLEQGWSAKRFASQLAPVVFPKESLKNYNCPKDLAT